MESLSTGLEQLAVKPVVPMSIVRISVVRIIIILVVGVIIPEGTSKKEITIVPEMISVSKVLSSMLCEAMAAKPTPTKPSEMATATCEMPATEMATTAEASTMPTTKASTMATASSAMPAAASAVSKCGGGCDR